MPKCKLEHAFKFSAKDQVFFLSSNFCRIERGTIEQVSLRCHADLESPECKPFGITEIYTVWARENCYKLFGSQIFATREEAEAYRRVNRNCKFDQLRSSIRNYLQLMMKEIPARSLDSERRKKEYAIFKKFFKELLEK